MSFPLAPNRLSGSKKWGRQKMAQIQVNGENLEQIEKLSKKLKVDPIVNNACILMLKVSQKKCVVSPYFPFQDKSYGAKTDFNDPFQLILPAVFCTNRI
jgi:hypothetical protein